MVIDNSRPSQSTTSICNVLLYIPFQATSLFHICDTVHVWPNTVYKRCAAKICHLYPNMLKRLATQHHWNQSPISSGVKAIQTKPCSMVTQHLIWPANQNSPEILRAYQYYHTSILMCSNTQLCNVLEISLLSLPVQKIIVNKCPLTKCCVTDRFLNFTRNCSSAKNTNNFTANVLRHPATKNSWDHSHISSNSKDIREQTKVDSIPLGFWSLKHSPQNSSRLLWQYLVKSEPGCECKSECKLENSASTGKGLEK